MGLSLGNLTLTEIDMSRTYRKKHNMSKSALMLEVGRMKTIDPSVYDWWKISVGRLTIDDHYAHAEQWAKKWKRIVTTDNQSKGWRPWTKVVKHYNNRRSRTFYRNELSKVYRDWEYDVVDVKHNRHDDTWNWD